MSNPKTCPVCESSVKGRSDKVFCSVKCKSIHQYETRQEKEAFYLDVDRQLKVNRKVLKTYNLSGFTTVRKELLINDGFNPNFFTHYWKNSKGDIYLFVYDYGFLDLKKSGKEKYLIVQWQAYMKK
jgi:predicted nucleic acid-binding Zn ribbon protein